MAVVRASARKRSMNSLSVENSALSTLTATRRPSRESTASHTWPIPPVAMSRCSR